MARKKIRFGNRHIPLPASRVARLALGVVLILLGLVGFLPVIGFWMIPLGLLVISYDIPLFRRLRRRVVLWWNGRGNGTARDRARRRAKAAEKG